MLIIAVCANEVRGVVGVPGPFVLGNSRIEAKRAGHLDTLRRILGIRCGEYNSPQRFPGKAHHRMAAPDPPSPPEVYLTFCSGIDQASVGRLMVTFNIAAHRLRASLRR
jgi:hypothetical protein